VNRIHLPGSNGDCKLSWVSKLASVWTTHISGGRIRGTKGGNWRAYGPHTYLEVASGKQKGQTGERMGHTHIWRSHPGNKRGKLASVWITLVSGGQVWYTRQFPPLVVTSRNVCDPYTLKFPPFVSRYDLQKLECVSFIHSLVCSPKVIYISHLNLGGVCSSHFWAVNMANPR
jgi:hypothetical protein